MSPFFSMLTSWPSFSFPLWSFPGEGEGRRSSLFFSFVGWPENILLPNFPFLTFSSMRKWTDKRSYYWNCWMCLDGPLCCIHQSQSIQSNTNVNWKENYQFTHLTQRHHTAREHLLLPPCFKCVDSPRDTWRFFFSTTLTRWSKSTSQEQEQQRNPLGEKQIRNFTRPHADITRYGV